MNPRWCRKRTIATWMIIVEFEVGGHFVRGARRFLDSTLACRRRSEQPAAVRNPVIRGEQHDLAVGIGEAECQHLRHEFPDLTLRKRALLIQDDGLPGRGPSAAPPQRAFSARP